MFDDPSDVVKADRWRLLDGAGSAAGERLKTHVVAANILLAIILAGVLTLTSLSNRDNQIKESYATATTISHAVAEHTRQVFKTLQSGVNSAASLLPETIAVANRDRVLADLVEIQRDFPQILIFYVVDSNGDLVATSTGLPSQAVNVADYPEFIYHRDNPDTEARVGMPRLSRNTSLPSQWIMMMTRRLETSDGQFVGVAAATLSLGYLIDFYDSLDLPDDSVLGLILNDGTLLARVPIIEPMIGQSLKDGPLVAAILNGENEGTAEVTSLDRHPRLVAFQVLGDLGVSVYVGLSRQQALADWRRNSLLITALGLLVLGFFATGSALVYRQTADIQQAERRRTHRLRALTEVTKALVSCHSSSMLAAELATRSVALLRASETCVLLPARQPDDEDIRVTSSGLPPSAFHPAICAVGGLAAATIADRHLRSVSRAELDAMHPVSSPVPPLPASHLLIVPIIDRTGEASGVICLMDPEETAESSWAEAQQIANFAGLCLEGIQATETLSRLLIDAQNSQREIEGIFTSISDAVVAIDRGWHFTFLNDEAERVLGVNRGSLLGKHLLNDFPNLRGSEVERVLIAVLERREEVATEYWMEQGRKLLAGRVYPTDDGATLYFRDITKERQTEEGLRQAQKLESIGKLTGGIAHDFNNMLTVIIGSADVAIELLPDEQAVAREQIETIRVAGERAAELTHRLLAFARRQPLDPRTVDPDELVLGMGKMLRRVIGETVDIVTLAAGIGWKAVADPGELQNAILNLAINARDAMPDGGKLTIETAGVSVDETYASDNLLQTGDYVVIAVSDTGIGMDAETVRQAFEPFFTTKPMGHGSGLGLSMVFGFARQSGGHVKIYSEPGEGTTVRLYLPRSTANDAVSEKRREDRNSLAGSEHVLVVEDDDLVRQHTVQSLETLGYTVSAFANGEGAIEAVRGGLSYDLLLTDVVLPGRMSGRDVANALATIRPSAKVLYMSGYTENSIVHHGRLDAGINLLSKPFRLGDLARKIRQVLALV